VEFLPKLKIEVAVADEIVGLVVAALVKGARSGKIGDGTVFVLPLEEAVRIRTDERGESAL
jgi:nitrogen regulatory protein P-II 1